MYIKNVKSKKTGKKDIIKIDNDIDVNMDILGYIDTNITVNIIKKSPFIIGDFFRYLLYLIHKDPSGIFSDETNSKSVTEESQKSGLSSLSAITGVTTRLNSSTQPAFKNAPFITLPPSKRSFFIWNKLWSFESARFISISSFPAKIYEICNS